MHRNMPRSEVGLYLRLLYTLCVNMNHVVCLAPLGLHTSIPSFCENYSFLLPCRLRYFGLVGRLKVQRQHRHIFPRRWLGHNLEPDAAVNGYQHRVGVEFCHSWEWHFVVLELSERVVYRHWDDWYRGWGYYNQPLWRTESAIKRIYLWLFPFPPSIAEA